MSDNNYDSVLVGYTDGKPCCSVFDPNSEAAKTKRAEKAAKVEAVSDDMPF